MPDVYEQFDKNLYKVVGIGPIQSTEIDPVNIGPGSLLSTLDQKVGNIEFTDVNIGRTNITLEPNQDMNEAIATLVARGGGVLNLKAGTHTLTEDVSGKTEISIVGEGRDITIIDCVSLYGLDYTGTAGTPLTNFKLADFTLKDSANTAGIDIDFCDFFRANNVRVTSCDNEGFQIRHSQNYNLMNCRSDHNGSDGFLIWSDSDRKTDSVFVTNCLADSNTHDGFNIGATGGFIFDFVLTGNTASSNDDNGFEIEAQNVSVNGSLLSCNAEFNGGEGFYSRAGEIKFIACQSDSNTGDGFEINNLDNTLIGVSANNNSGEDYDFNASVLVVGNAMRLGSLAPDEVMTGLNTHAASVVIANRGQGTKTFRDMRWMKNTSGGSLAIGNVVVFKAAADGDEITTTTAQGDDLVFGMSLNASANNIYGGVLVEGFTNFLKVDGTDDIAIGDHLATFTSAGIAAKAGVGDMAFAIALEAYTANDSNGTIDALIIKPRKI